jgi:hypothetical protein
MKPPRGVVRRNARGASGKYRESDLSTLRKNVEAAAGFEPAHNGFAVRSLNHLGTPPLLGGTHTYTTRAARDSAREASCVDRALISAVPSPSRIAVAPPR